MAYSTTNPMYPRPARDNTGTLIADQRLTVDATAGGVQLTAFGANCDIVVLDVQDYDVMVTFDGSAPTTTNGHHLVAGEKYTWSKDAAETAKFIRQGANSAAIHASPFRI